MPLEAFVFVDPNQSIGNTQGLPGVMPPTVVVQGKVRFFTPGKVKK